MVQLYEKLNGNTITVKNSQIPNNIREIIIRLVNKIDPNIEINIVVKGKIGYEMLNDNRLDKKLIKLRFDEINKNHGLAITKYDFLLEQYKDLKICYVSMEHNNLLQDIIHEAIHLKDPWKLERYLDNEGGSINNFIYNMLDEFVAEYFTILNLLNIHDLLESNSLFRIKRINPNDYNNLYERFKIVKENGLLSEKSDKIIVKFFEDFLIPIMYVLGQYRAFIEYLNIDLDLNKYPINLYNDFLYSIQNDWNPDLIDFFKKIKDHLIKSQIENRTELFIREYYDLCDHFLNSPNSILRLIIS